MVTTRRIRTLMCVLALASAPMTEVARAQEHGTPQEGIKVHGDWTLVVRNPDGSVAARHEFKNALATHLGGDRLLAELIGGTAVVGQWTVALFTTPIAACNTNNAPCQITESASPNAANSRDLTRTVPTTGPDARKLVLRGSVRIPSDATIGTVQTDLTNCGANVTPTACVSATGVGFSQRVLTGGVPVVAGQLVEVTVVISFS